VCVWVWVWVYVCVCVRVCVCVCVYVYVGVYVCVGRWVSACTYVDVHSWQYTVVCARSCLCAFCTCAPRVHRCVFVHVTLRTRRYMRLHNLFSFCAVTLLSALLCFCVCPAAVGMRSRTIIS
jgi:hypothetical protein